MGIILDAREPIKFKKLLDAKGLKHDIRQLMTGDVIVYNDEEPEV